MKINLHLNLCVLLTIAISFSSPFIHLCEANDRRSLIVNGVLKQYDVIETKQYQVVEVESLAGAVDAAMSLEEQAISDAERDASLHLNKVLWFSAGCFAPLIGPIVSQWYQPFMPTARVLGKPPQYVSFYYDAYKVKTKKLQFNWALGGCLVGLPAGACLLTALYNINAEN